MTLPAKCPHCGGVGCDFCFNGQVVVSLPSKEADAYTMKCNDCGFENGCLFVGENCLKLEKFRTRKPQSCVMCRSDNVVWLKI